jgi:hypothetical protein
MVQAEKGFTFALAISKNGCLRDASRGAQQRRLISGC